MYRAKTGSALVGEDAPLGVDPLAERIVVSVSPLSLIRTFTNSDCIVLASKIVDSGDNSTALAFLVAQTFFLRRMERYFILPPTK